MLYTDLGPNYTPQPGFIIKDLIITVTIFFFWCICLNFFYFQMERIILLKTPSEKFGQDSWTGEIGAGKY